MKRQEFEKLIARAADELPANIRAHIKNVAFVAEKNPPRGQKYLLGLYHGIPLDSWGRDFGGKLPDVITIYREPIERVAGGNEEEIRRVVRDTVWHEVGHYLGYDDKQLRKLEKKWRRGDN